MLEIVNDRLQVGGAPVEFVPTVHVGGRIEPTLIVLHDTAGGPPGDSVSWLRSNPREVSAHCIVRPDGSVVQLAPFDRRTNHAGPSQRHGRSGCNGWSIGIEIVNPGRLRGTADRAVSSFGRAYTAADGVAACPADPCHAAGLWLAYTEAQLATVETLIEALARTYPTIADLAGHHDICEPPGRKEDPTPLMPWPRMAAALARVRLDSGSAWSAPQSAATHSRCPGAPCRAPLCARRCRRPDGAAHARRHPHVPGPQRPRHHRHTHRADARAPVRAGCQGDDHRHT
jgi:N-acetylmuramoyl-L-alanine amidase